MSQNDPAHASGNSDEESNYDLRDHGPISVLVIFVAMVVFFGGQILITVVPRLPCCDGATLSRSEQRGARLREMEWAQRTAATETLSSTAGQPATNNTAPAMNE